MMKLVVYILLAMLTAGPVRADLVDDFSRNPDVLSAKISPTGEYLAVMKEEEEQNVVAVFTFPAMKLINVIDFPGKNEVGNYWWVNDERILVSIMFDWAGYEDERSYGELYAVNADGKRGKYLFGLRGDQAGNTRSRVSQVSRRTEAASLQHPLWHDPRKILITIRDLTRGFKSTNTVAKLDVYSGRVSDELRPPTSNASILTDRRGEVRFSYYVDDDQNTVIHSRDAQTGEWSLFSSAPYGQSQVEPIHVADDGRIYVRKSEDDGPMGLYLLTPKTNAYEELLQHDTVDLSGLYEDFDGNVYGAVVQPGKPERYWLDPTHPEAQLLTALEPVFPDAYTYVTSTTHDYRFAIVRRYEDTRTPEYYLFDRETNQLQLLFDAMPWMNDELLSPMQPIEITARDGVSLQGYLTIPKGAPGENLPLVIVPHGGPHGPRDSWGFQWFEGIVPAAGYAMLQINYRGSGGYGTAFERMGHREWAGKMQDDLTDAVKWAIEQGVADPDRICIFGWSYGGYAAVMSIAREPELYRCSVAGAGVYDQDVQYNQADFADQTRWGKKYIDKVIGPTRQDRHNASPINYVDRIVTPLLLVHGEEDERVPIDHAYDLQRAFKKAGKPVPELIELENEGHTPRNEQNNLHWRRKVIQFFDQHIGPGLLPEA